MTPWIGWALAVLAVAAGYLTQGWPGVVLAVTVVVFWMLLQFSRTLRAMRLAGRRPVGSTPNAVMLNARLREGLTMLQVLPLAGSLGRTEGEQAEERFGWTDRAGDTVHTEFRQGRLLRWTLERRAAMADAADGEAGRELAAAPAPPEGRGGAPSGS